MAAEPSRHEVDNVQVVEVCGTVLTYKPILQSHGWVTIGGDGNKLPYLIRNGERFIPLSIIESVYLSKYREPYPEKLGRQPMKGFYLTTEEVRLLNRFVTQNYTQQLGLARFSLKDMLVAVYDFVDFYNRLLTASIPQEADQPPPVEDEKQLVEGGWSQVNNTIIPYVTRNKVKMVPLSVVRYAAGLLCDLDVPSLDVNEEECRYLNQACVDEGLNFHFQLNTKLIELFLIPTLSKTRVSIRELPQKNPMQHAKFISRCTERRSVFVAASVSRSGMVRRRQQKKHSNRRRSSGVAGESTASPAKSLAAPDESHPVEPTNAFSASGQPCQISSLPVTSAKEGQQETDAYPPVNLTGVLPTQDSTQQDLVVLAELATRPPLMQPTVADASMPPSRPELTISRLNSISSNPSPTMQPRYAAEDVFQPNAFLPPTNVLPAALPIASEPSHLQAAPSLMSTTSSIMTGPNVPVPPPMFVISDATPAIASASLTPTQTPAVAATPIPEPVPDALVPKQKPSVSALIGEMPELIPVIPELPRSPDIIKIDISDDDTESYENWDQRPRDTVTYSGSVEHVNNFNKEFYSNTHPNDRLNPSGIYKRQLDILGENDHLFTIKRQKWQNMEFCGHLETTTH